MTDEPEKATTINIVPEQPPGPEQPKRIFTAREAIEILVEFMEQARPFINAMGCCLKCGVYVNITHDQTETRRLVDRATGADIGLVYVCGRCRKTERIVVPGAFGPRPH